MTDLQRDIGALEARINAVESRLERIEGKMDQFLSFMDQSKGGIRMLIAVGGVAASLATVLTAMIGRALQWWGKG